MTKKQHGFYIRYINASATQLSDVYKSWSGDKQKAYDYCLKKCVDMNGINPRITSANTYDFCMAWEYIDENGCYCLNYETPTASYNFPIEIVA